MAINISTGSRIRSRNWSCFWDWEKFNSDKKTKMKSSPAFACLRYCCVLGVLSFIALVLCTMKNGYAVETDSGAELEDRVVAVGREAPVESGSTLQRMSRKKRYVAFPEGSSVSVSPKWYI